MNNDISQYAQAIKELRVNLGLSQDDLVDILAKYPNKFPKCPYSRESISRLENGKRSEKIFYVRLIHALLKIEEEKLYE